MQQQTSNFLTYSLINCLKSKKVNILFIFLICFMFSASTQEMFTTDVERFHRDFGSTLRFSGEVREGDDNLRREFINFWTSDILSYEEKINFIETANIMGSKGCKEYPDFVCLAANIMAFKRKNISAECYNNYETALIDLLTVRRPNLRDVSDYMLNINRLVERDIVCKNPRTLWKAENNNFSIFYENNEFKILFHKINLVGYQNVDSLKIEKTNGEYFPDRKLWNGKGGFVTWERVGYGRDSIIAELSDYSIDLRNVSYTADSVLFTNSIFFRTPMRGRLIDKTRNIEDPSRSNYPRFVSYQQHFVIRNLVKGLDYEGGFSIQGRSFIGSGTIDKPARISIVKNDSVSFTALSQRFIIDRDFILSDNTTVTIQISEDSIYHPNLRFKFNNKIGLLELIRTKEGMSKVGFVNSYHQLNMDFTHLSWFIDKFKIELSMISTPGVPNESFFESVDYYRRERYRDIQKRDPRHPLEVVTSFATVWKDTEYFLNDLAKYMGYGDTQVRRMVLDLAYRNYLFYDPQSDIIRVYPEASRFLEAHVGARDSDVLQFHSRTDASKSNAELSLLNYDLKINGITAVHLSDSQNVRVHPIDHQINLQKNRSFTFNGTIQAGQFYYYGNNFKFDYEKFKIELPNCDSMKMVAETPYLDERGEPRLAIVRNKLEGISGEFYIDEPMNKSGRSNYPEYPQFITHTNSYVYFDRPDIYGGIYDRNRFYFEVDPFVIDSISGHSGDNLVFEGTLVSGGIFPDIKEKLIHRKDDFSLGFNTNTGPLGYPLYDGLATYWHEVDLSNHGLRGKGRIEYLSADFNADYLVFFIDSLHGHSEKMNIAARESPVQYPDVSGTDNTLRWLIREDQFNIRNKSDEFIMYDEQTTLDGSLNLTSEGLLGDGVVEFTNARLTSNQFDFKKDIINSDTAAFDIFTEDVLNVDFESDNVNATVDFIARKGTFKTNGESTIWRFPRNQYISEMNELSWYMDADEIAISASSDALAQLENVDAESNPQQWEDLFLEGPRFTSIHPQQDSLSFVAPQARYNYRAHIITAEGVEFIRVADATIFPENKQLIVKRNAVMDPIERGTITANNITRYHNIYDAEINIKGRRHYLGHGDYDFIDAMQNVQKVHLNKIDVDNTGQTIASADVVEPDDFMISPNYHFFGKVNLYANQQHLEFDGSVKTMHECEKFQANWIKFKEIIDPEDIYIPISTPLFDINQNRLSTGLLLTQARQVYPTFLTRKTTQNDQEIFSVDGYLYFDIEDGNYKIAQKDKMVETSLPGNYIEMHRFICNVYGEGKMNFSNDFGQFKPNIIGSFRYNPEADTVDFFVSMIMEAYFNSNAIGLMAGQISKTRGLMGLNLRDRTYEKAIVEYLGTEQADEWISNLSMGNYRRMPRELQNKIILTELKFIWYPELNSFVHYGPIGIANMEREQVNRYVFGFIKIENSRRGDVFEMLLEPDSDTWYYFRYSAGNYTGISSDEEFNKEVYDTRPAQRELKDDEGPRYIYGLGSSSHMRRFKRDMYRKFNIPVVDDDKE